jgi:hypothetical protein
MFGAAVTNNVIQAIQPKNSVVLALLICVTSSKTILNNASIANNNKK